MGRALILILVLVPLLGAGVAWRAWRPARRNALLVAIAGTHAAAVTLLWFFPGAQVFSGWLAADDLGRLVLSIITSVFLVVAVHASGAAKDDTPRGGNVFVPCLLAFLAAASVVALSRHFALLWVGMESTTLAIAPLIYHRRDRRSLEAVWKYLVLSSVGIAFALLAVFLLASAQPVAAGVRPLMLADLVNGGAALDRAWLRFAIVFALIGFGTKMGLAPLHSWKPDTYGEAPANVGALMASITTTCAFVGVVRFVQVAEAAGIGDFVRPLLIAFGLFSMLVAAAFLLGQADIKRLLAYSSVEHMGLLVLGIGIGGAGAFGAVLHLVNNALAKGFLFLAVGNLVAAAGTSAAADMRGMLRVRPASAFLMLVGLFAITGAPPFGMFLSEFTIVAGALREHHPLVATAAVLLLVVIFVGIAALMIDVAYGEAPSGLTDAAGTGAQGASAPSASAPSASATSARASADAGPIAPLPRERATSVVGPFLLAGAVLLLGLYIPGPVRAAIARVAESVGGGAP